MDWEEMASLKPRPSAGMMVDWQMKLSTELTKWAPLLWSSLPDTSVTLSVQMAALFPWGKKSKEHDDNLSYVFGCPSVWHVAGHSCQRDIFRGLGGLDNNVVSCEHHV